MGSRERIKGARGERELEEILRGLHLEIDRRRRQAGLGGGDFYVTYRGGQLLLLEAKRGFEQPRWTAWIRKLFKNAIEEDVRPALAWRPDGVPDWLFLVPMTAAEFAEFAHELPANGRATAEDLGLARYAKVWTALQ
jgi:Holliday junction resolvase